MPKYLLIFGAGASCGSDSSGTPAIGENLFNALVSFNRAGWGNRINIPLELVRLFQENFEYGMKRLFEVTPTQPVELQKTMASYFYHFRPKQTNLYRSIGIRMRGTKWDGSIATLNYERLLELSLLEVGLRPICSREVKVAGEFELTFPHGCCHFFLKNVRGNNTVARLSINANQAHFDGDVEALGDEDAFWKRIQNDPIPPVMSYFVDTKDTTSGRVFLQNQRNHFAELVSKAETIGIVGLKVRTHDVHIWDPLAKASAQIIYCSGEDAGNEYKVWANNNRLGMKDRIIPRYFREAFDEICAEIGLAESSSK